MIVYLLLFGALGGILFYIYLAYKVLFWLYSKRKLKSNKEKNEEVKRHET